MAMITEATERVNRITSSGVTIATSCHTCNGSGLDLKEIDVGEIVDIYREYPDGNKIQRIKQVRSRWGIGLRPAKELVEAYDRLLTELTEISYS